MNMMPKKMFRARCADLGKTVTTRMKAGGMLMLAMIALCGIGASAQMNVNLTNSGPLTLKSGTYGSFTLTATPIGSYSGSFIISCTNLPQYASCVYPGLNQQMTVTSGAVSTTLILNTSQVNQYESMKTRKSNQAARIALCALFAPSALLLLAFRRGRRKGFGGLRAMLALVFMVSLGALSGCGNTVPASTPAGSYTFSVGAIHYANGPAFASTTVNLTVN